MNAIELLDSGVGRVALRDVAAIRKIESAALASLPPFTLMARAGAALARVALAVAPHAARIVVFAGPGNNGGDGIEAATRLADWGKAASVLRVAAAAALPADAAHALARAADAGVEVGAFDPDDAMADARPDLVIDALLGIGASRPPEGEIAAAIARIGELAARGARVLAVDVPSGFDADRGQPLGAACVVADDTLTLIAAKPGLFTGSGRDHAGRTWCARLDVRDNDDDAFAWLVGSRDRSCAAGPRRHSAHKGSFGDVAIVGGAPGMTGAAWLAARAAHAAGAGRVLVDLLRGAEGGQGAVAEVDPLRPELMFRTGWAASDAAVVAAATVVCGCGGGGAVRAALPRLLSIATRLVLDADALNAIGADASLQTLTAARALRGHATILTPHPLEAARLLATTAAAVQADRLSAARELAARYRSTVVLKGSGTVVADPDGTVRINATGNASLASAGTGDVLAGWIGGRWAAATGSALDVATCAVIEHGAAAEPVRPGALRAGDLVELLYRRARGD
ncbi:MAG TPA: NAD(P)H-hydrate dehydratase [Caldimonas sp.]|nr:NAD(P)H-hydrate dehydratase [Caldimonas sp.]HEV7578157.1 NAD(P)H-hydrate dehydratase [Caldimonas sp.]